VICQGEANVAVGLAFNGRTSTERVRVHFVSSNFFSSLGVHAYLGRALNAEDEHTQAMNAVLSYDFWRKRLRGDTSAVGRKIILGGFPFTVVGVSPEWFNGLAVDTSPDIRVPAAVDRYLVKPASEMNPAARTVSTQIFGRLQTGVAFERADADVDPLLHEAFQAEAEKIFPQAKGTTPDSRTRSRLRLEPIANGISTLRTQFSRSLEVLMAGVALLLLMACANVAGLLLARSATRAQEMGIRLALGASPGRIVRQLLTEGLVLSLLGGLAGTLLTTACRPVLVRELPPLRDRAAVLQPLALHIAIDLHVLGFALATTVLTAVLFALSPALRCARADVASGLKGGRTTTRRLSTGNLIVAAQVAICTLLLMGAVLLVETLERMRSMNPGFDRDRVVSLTIDPGLRGYTPEQARLFSKKLLEKAKDVTGVTAVSMASRALMRGTGIKATFGVAGARITAADLLDGSVNAVTPGYFETMGIYVLSGRAFNWFDRDRGTPHKVIVNQAFARHFFPGKNPLGERFGFPGPGGIATAADEIVGIVSDAKYRSLREPIPLTVYSAVVDGFDSEFTLYLRTWEHPEEIVAPVLEILHSSDPELPVIEVRTLREEVEASLWQERLLALLSIVFGAIAALLASIGLYGALDYAVKSRTREIGVRMALGAQPARIVGMVSREALLLTATGLVLGLCGYAAASVWIRRVVYDFRPWEPTIVLSVLLLVGLIAFIATAPAALRAARTDPGSTLRAE
jgi:predicted permease